MSAYTPTSRTTPAAAITRRRFTQLTLAGASGLGLSAALAACSSTDASGRYDTGFVEGAGVSTEIAPADRGEALDFTATTYSGDTFTLADHRGTPVLLNVWYASCAPCRKEAPDLVKLYEAFSPKGVTFIGVNVRDDKGPATAFEESFGIPYPSVPDLSGEVLYALRGQVAPNAVPSTVIFDAQGRVAARISGLADPSILKTMLSTVLAQ